MRILKNTNLHVILGVAFFAVAGNGILAPILGSLAEPMGRSLETLSYMLTVFTGSVIVFTPILGLLADRYGRRKILLPTIFLFGVGAFIPLTDSFGFMLFLRALQGVAVAGMASLAVTLIGDLYRGEERAKAMSLRTTVHSLGLASSPFIAGVLVTVNAMYPFYLFALVFPLWVYAYFFLDKDHDKFGSLGMKYVSDLWAVLKRRQTWAVFYSIFHICVLFYMMLIFVPILLSAQYGMTPFAQGAVVSFFFLLAALVSAGAQRMMERFRDQHIIVVSFAVIGFVLSVMPFVHSFPLFIILTIIWAIAHGISFTPIYVLASALTPTPLRAGAVAGAFMVTYLSVTISTPVFFYILSSTNNDLNITFLSAGIFALLPFLLALIGRFQIEEKPAEVLFGDPNLDGSPL